MVRLRQSLVRDAVADPTFVLFLAAIVLSLVRAADQPGVTVTIGSTAATVVPADVVLAALAAAVAVRVVRLRRYPRAAAAVSASAAAFAALVVLTATANGASAFVAAGKLVELGALTLAAVVLVDRPERVWAVAALLVAITVAAVAWALVGFAGAPGRRQASFLGEHDLAALSTASLVLGLAALHCRHRLGRLPLVAGVAGSAGIALGAALASLLGLYLAGAALIAVAAARGVLRLRSVGVTVLVAVALTATTYVLRGSDLGFLRQWLAPAQNAQPGQYAGSWSQRLIFSYIGGRIFLERPVLGTGWWGELPPSEYARFLPDARRRFPDQPARYFPPARRSFIPQQTYDQVLYELGLVGAATLVVLAAASVRDARRAAIDWPARDADELAAYLPAGWLASLAGALAGAALFGGSPIAALFWLTLGLVAALAALSRSRGAPAHLPSEAAWPA